MVFGFGWAKPKKSTERRVSPRMQQTKKESAKPAESTSKPAATSETKSTKTVTTTTKTSKNQLQVVTVTMFNEAHQKIHERFDKLETSITKIITQQRTEEVLVTRKPRLPAKRRQSVQSRTNKQKESKLPPLDEKSMNAIGKKKTAAAADYPRARRENKFYNLRTIKKRRSTTDV